MTSATLPVSPPSALKSGDWALLVLRIGLGVVFLAHGSQKVLGLFGGPGLAATVGGMSKMGVPVPLAYLASLTELLGGLAVLIGLLARTAALGLAIVMAVAVFMVHFSNGFFEQNHGFEYPFTLLMIAIALILAGPGKLAISDPEARLLPVRRHVP